MKFKFQVTNNAAEYEALLLGLQLALSLNVTRLKASSDSKLMVEQIGGGYDTKEDVLVQYLAKVRLLIVRFEYFSIQHVPREENTLADALSKLSIIDIDNTPNQVFVEILEQSVLSDYPQSLNISHDESWMTPVEEFVNEVLMLGTSYCVKFKFQIPDKESYIRTGKDLSKSLR